MAENLFPRFMAPYTYPISRERARSESAREKMLFENSLHKLR
jgi:hypothetical protein